MDYLADVHKIAEFLNDTSELLELAVEHERINYMLKNR